MTKTKDVSSITEYTVKSNPDTSAGRATWYWDVLENVVRQAELDGERSKGVLAAIYLVSGESRYSKAEADHSRQF
ncbi:MAG: hypothetical protein QXY74_07625 [Candidatus Bathyarchaeia archaeon]